MATYKGKVEFAEIKTFSTQLCCIYVISSFDQTIWCFFLMFICNLNDNKFIRKYELFFPFIIQERLCCVNEYARNRICFANFIQTQQFCMGHEKLVKTLNVQLTWDMSFILKK